MARRRRKRKTRKKKKRQTNTNSLTAESPRWHTSSTMGWTWNIVNVPKANKMNWLIIKIQNVLLMYKFNSKHITRAKRRLALLKIETKSMRGRPFSLSTSDWVSSDSLYDFIEQFTVGRNEATIHIYKTKN